MSDMGEVLSWIFSTELDEATGKAAADPKAFVKMKFNSKKLSKTFLKLGHKFENMEDEFKKVAQIIGDYYILHYDTQMGPDPRTGQMISWPDYNVNKKTGEQEWLKQKKAKGKSEHLLTYDLKLSQSLLEGAEGNIWKVTNKGITIGTDIFYYYFHHFGYKVEGGHSIESMKRPIIGLTEDEEKEIVDTYIREVFEGIVDE